MPRRSRAGNGNVRHARRTLTCLLDGPRPARSGHPASPPCPARLSRRTLSALGGPVEECDEGGGRGRGRSAGPTPRRADRLCRDHHLRRWLRERGIMPRIARRGIESSHRLGSHRWVVERTMSWLAGCRRLHRRYEREAEHFLAFTGISAALICLRRLVRADAQNRSAT
ncbi:transposase [Streptomyces sp. NPDC086519]|uniref:transposase n=1 Tax=Streptomyces sp. NPDC086519 TaxID=3154863 RepID=UPI0034147B98